jgi:hypothetical protein
MPRNATATPNHHRDPRPLIERILERDDAGKRAVRTVTINLAESPLAWLHARGHLNDRQLLAGEKLRYDYEAACIGPKITMQWDAAPISRSRRAAPAPMEASERVLSAKDRFDHALEILGSDLSDIAWRVICAGEGIPLAERAMGWPIRSGKLVLRIALDRLAGYYRLPG